MRHGVLLLALLLAMPARAAGDWVRYENSHFVTFSNAPEKKVLVLLGELETFRGAFLQVGSLLVPPEAPKTLVYITATQKEFTKLARNKLQAGLAFFDGRRTLILVSAQGERKWTRTVIRHEYAHALLRYKKFPYPAWYEEGFAELLSSTELVNNGKSFTIGAPPARAQNNGPPIFDWNELVSGKFDPHTITNANVGSSAYAQAWLLAHYATLGNNLKNAQILQDYFNRLMDEKSHDSAFQDAFGMSAEALWETQLRDYARQIPYYTIAYRPGGLDLQFATSRAEDAQFDSVQAYLLSSAAVSGTARPPADVVAALPGRWAPLRIDAGCDEYVDLSLGPAAGPGAGSATLTTSAGVTGSTTTESEDLRYELSGDGSVIFRPAPAGDLGSPGDETPILRVQHRTADLMCFGPPETGVPECAVLMQRCPHGPGPVVP